MYDCVRAAAHLRSPAHLLSLLGSPPLYALCVPAKGLALANPHAKRAPRGPGCRDVEPGRPRSPTLSNLCVNKAVFTPNLADAAAASHPA